MPASSGEDLPVIPVGLPLYKKSANAGERAYHITQDDAPFIADVYVRALILLRKRIPNITDQGNIIAGFSNGGHSMGAFFADNRLASMFQYYILAEGGGEIRN